MSESDALFEAFEFEGVSLDNRVGLAPMTRTSATDDGRATERMAQYYAKFARGGFGFLVSEGVYPDTEHSQGYLNQPGLATEEQTEAWQKVTEAVHEEGKPIFAQLMHAGAISQGNRYEDETVAPSAIQPDGEKSELYGGSGAFDTPRELELEELGDIEASFVDAAKNAQKAGFDGIELHGANGYLLNEFLAPDANQREDRYGGDAENRARFPAEVVEAVSAALPDEFVVGIRVSQTKVNDETYEWPGEEYAATVFEELAEAGADYIHTTEGDALASAFGDDGPTFAEIAVEHADTTVIANGGLGDPESARASLDDGADLLTLGTSALANADWPERVRNGEELDEFDPGAILVPEATIGDDELPDPDAVSANADD